MKNIRTIKKMCKDLDCILDQSPKNFFGFECIEITAPERFKFNANDATFLVYSYNKEIEEITKAELYEYIIEDLNQGLRQ